MIELMHLQHNWFGYLHGLIKYDIFCEHNITSLFCIDGSQKAVACNIATPLDREQ